MNDKCPWCGSENAQLHLELKDLFLTQEQFKILECKDCGLLYTTPRPNKEEIGSYYKSDEYYSHQENKDGFIPKVYEKVKSINLKNKYHIATEKAKKGKILDIGCGVGDFLHTMEQQGWDCTGVEPSEDAKAIARKRIKAQLLSSEEQENLPEGSFDVITMWHVLEHVDALRWQIQQLYRLCRSGGRIIIALPNYKSYDGQYYKAEWAAYDVPRHLNHFDQKTLINLFEENEMKHIKTKKLYWDAFYISYMSEKYRQHSLPLVRGVFRGMVSNLKARMMGEWSSLVYVFER